MAASGKTTSFPVRQVINCCAKTTFSDIDRGNNMHEGTHNSLKLLVGAAAVCPLVASDDTTTCREQIRGTGKI